MYTYDYTIRNTHRNGQHSINFYTMSGRVTWSWLIAMEDIITDDDVDSVINSLLDNVEFESDCDREWVAQGIRQYIENERFDVLAFAR